MFALLIFPGANTAEIAFTPEASVLGFKDDVSLFQANHPSPWHRLTTAFASSFVRRSNRLYICPDGSSMKG